MTGSDAAKGLAEVRLETAGLGPGDALVVASNAGRNAYPIDAALTGRRLGACAIALTLLPRARSVASRHASGQRRSDRGGGDPSTWSARIPPLR